MFFVTIGVILMEDLVSTAAKLEATVTKIFWDLLKMRTDISRLPCPLLLVDISAEAAPSLAEHLQAGVI